MRVVKLPPHILAVLATRVHELCHLCGRYIEYPVATVSINKRLNVALICAYCHQHLSHNLPIYSIKHPKADIPLYAASYYQPPLNRVMAMYKDYGGVSALMVLYHLLAVLPRPKYQAGTTVLLPTPTTAGRILERGFNPVLILVRYLSYLWHLPIWQGIARIDNVTHQRGLGRAERLQNVKQDFYLDKELDFRVNHVILFDDVVTTGSTLSAMADILWKHYPDLEITAVSVLHGKYDMHLPVFG